MLCGEQIGNWRMNCDTHTPWGGGEPGAPDMVTVHGMLICKVCGAVESELDDETCADHLARRLRRENQP